MSLVLLGMGPDESHTRTARDLKGPRMEEQEGGEKDEEWSSGAAIARLQIA
jgi:hypothetical protein